MKEIQRMAMDEELSRVLIKAGIKLGGNNPIEVDSLDQREKLLIGRWYNQLLIHLDDVVHQESLGLLDQDELVKRTERYELAKHHMDAAEKLQLYVPIRLQKHWQEMLDENE